MLLNALKKPQRLLEAYNLHIQIMEKQKMYCLHGFAD